MSIDLKKRPDSGNWGELVITSHSGNLSEEDYVNRIQSLIELVKNQDEENYDPLSTRYVLEIVSDMLPTDEQAKKMFNSPH